MHKNKFKHHVSIVQHSLVVKAEAGLLSFFEPFIASSHGRQHKHDSECLFYLTISMFDQPLNGPWHEFGQRKANHPKAGNWFCVATGCRRSLFKQTQTERLNGLADSRHTRCLLRLVCCGWEGAPAAEREGRDAAVAISLCKLQRTRSTKFILNLTSVFVPPKKPKPTEYRTDGAAAAGCGFPANPNASCRSLRCHLNLTEACGRWTAADLRAGFVFS